MKNKIILHSHSIMLLVCALGFNCLAYGGGRILAANKVHLSFATALDNRIPLIPWTIFIYLGCYLFWIVNYILGVMQDRKEADCFIMAHCIGEVVCFFAFVFLPTTMIRPEIMGTTIPDQLLRFTYQVDKADNLLPSIHCFVSWLCWIAVRKNRKIPKWYQAASLLMAIAVCISTLTVRQHVLVDVVVGILLAEAGYLIAGMIKNIRLQSYNI